MTLDGGKNWKKLGKEDGLPEGNLWKNRDWHLRAA